MKNNKETTPVFFLRSLLIKLNLVIVSISTLPTDSFFGLTTFTKTSKNQRW